MSIQTIQFNTDLVCSTLSHSREVADKSYKVCPGVRQGNSLRERQSDPI